MVIPKHEFPTWYAFALYPPSLFFTSIKQKEDERLRTQLRRENQQRRMRERSQAKGLSASFLEPDRYEDDGEDLEQSLLAIKNKYKKKLTRGLLIWDNSSQNVFFLVMLQVKIKIRLNFFFPRLILNFLCVLVLIIRELGQGEFWPVTFTIKLKFS